MTIQKKIIFFFLLLTSVNLWSEKVIDYDFNYSLDLPEGAIVSEYTQDGFSYRFEYPNVPVGLIIKLYDDKSFNDCKSALENVFNRFSSTYQIDNFLWRNTECIIGTFSMPILGGNKGWAVCVNLPESNFKLVLLSYAQESKFNDLEQFVISIINSLVIDKEGENYPGIITSYAFPNKEERIVNLNICGINVSSIVCADDIEANQFVVECEFAVLSLYANDEKWKEAWTRYYKTIYRDSFSRLFNISNDINNTISLNYKTMNKKYNLNVLNELLLEWVQGFDYKRNNQKQTDSDFTNLISAVLGEGCDCDSRSMLLTVIFNNLGCNSALFVSREYSHAVYGLNTDAQGAKIKVGEVEYLLSETTAKNIKPGLIAKEHNDTEKWLPIVFK